MGVGMDLYILGLSPYTYVVHQNSHLKCLPLQCQFSDNLLGHHSRRVVATKESYVLSCQTATAVQLLFGGGPTVQTLISLYKLQFYRKSHWLKTCG